MFKLEIDLGDAAMKTPDDVARALRQVADTLDTEGGRAPVEGYSLDGRIRDLNGNTVGKWFLDLTDVDA